MSAKEKYLSHIYCRNCLDNSIIFHTKDSVEHLKFLKSFSLTLLFARL